MTCTFWTPASSGHRKNECRLLNPDTADLRVNNVHAPSTEAGGVPSLSSELMIAYHQPIFKSDKLESTDEIADFISIDILDRPLSIIHCPLSITQRQAASHHLPSPVYDPPPLTSYPPVNLPPAS